MPHLRKLKTRLSIITILIILLIAIIYINKAEVLIWHIWHSYKSPDHHGLDISRYRVAIEGRPLNGYKDVSDITYNQESGTLFIVLNKDNMIVEISPDGTPLRNIKVQGSDDLEGITYTENNYFVLADERHSKLWLLQIKPEDKEVTTDKTKQLRIGIDSPGNKNFEGVSWDSANHRLIVVKEKNPKYVLSVKGFYHPGNINQDKIEIERLSQYDHALEWVLRDLSAVTYHDKSGHLFLLSDESKLLKQFNEFGQAMGSLALWKGFHGLNQNVPQAEGVATDNEGNIYVVSEPNLFYVFKPS